MTRPPDRLDRSELTRRCNATSAHLAESAEQILLGSNQIRQATRLAGTQGRCFSDDLNHKADELEMLSRICSQLSERISTAAAHLATGRCEQDALEPLEDLARSAVVVLAAEVERCRKLLHRLRNSAPAEHLG